MIEYALLILAAVFALLAALGVPSSGSKLDWMHFGWLAVFFLVVALLFGSVAGGGLGRRAALPESAAPAIYPFSSGYLHEIQEWKPTPEMEQALNRMNPRPRNWFEFDKMRGAPPVYGMRGGPVVHDAPIADRPRVATPPATTTCLAGATENCRPE